jgi:hypothetical protein
MRRLLLLLAVCSLFTITLPSAAAQDHIELFGGYSFVHASTPITTTFTCPAPICPVTTSTFHPNLNGWEFSATYKPHSWFGLTADFNGTYGSSGSSSVHQQTYLFGPQVSFPGPVSPFAHVLVGGAHQSVGSGSPGPLLIALPTSDSAFAAAVGVGIDIKFAPFVSLRPIQIDYLATRFNSSTQSQPRVSAGVVFHF